jgi:hypothetical protein
MYLDLEGLSDRRALDPREALARLLLTLGASRRAVPSQVDEAAALFRASLPGRRFLLVLDNAADADQVRPLLPAGTTCAALVTSSQALFEIGDALQVRVGPVSAVEALDLLAH